MLPILALATLALSVPAPINVNYTADSVYKADVITVKDLIEQEDGLYTIVLEPEHLLGYCIYDNKNTEYVDGLKFDDNFVTNYTVTDVDLAVEHTILIKTVYTEDVAGMLAAAKNGDWSRILSNPLIIFQIGYYILAAISIILGGFGLLKAKKSKIKTNDEIAASVKNQAIESGKVLTSEAKNIISEIVKPLCTKLTTQNQKIIEALILAQSSDKASKIALIDLLKSTATEDVSLLSDSMTKAIENADALKEKAKEEAKKVVDQISQGSFDDIGGLSI